MGCKVNIVPLLALLALILLTNPSQSNADLHRLLRRQLEQESTTAASATSDHDQPQSSHQQQPLARLYPDLPRQPPLLAPNFASGPTPFVPFGPQPMGYPPMMQQPHQMMPSDRLQSQTFTNGLGKRLMSMLGIESHSKVNTNGTTASGSAGENVQMPAGNDLMRALSNSTVLQQINTGLQSVYGGLSKMYNSTVQQQLEMLRNSFKRQAENSTNLWQQSMAQQVPQFFQRMALKVNEAQQNLNHVLHQIMEMRQQNGSQVEPQTRQALGGQLGSNQFFGSNEGNFLGNNPQMGGNFFNQMGSTFGFGQPQDSQQPRDVGSHLMDFWHHQVQPQMAMIRGTVGRVWRDLTQSGTLQTTNLMTSSQQPQHTNQQTGRNEGAQSELVDSILKDVNMASTEYKLVDPVADSGQQQPRNNMGSQMQTRLMSMQRELNQLWNGLSNSLQNALGSVRQSLNPHPQFGPVNFAINDNANTNKDTVNQAANEISARIKDLNKVQKDADVVYDVVQQQQQQQEQRPTFTDRFRNFIGNMDLEHVDQFSNRVGEQVMQFGNAVGDIWHHLPDRWNNFMQNIGQQEPVARFTKPTTSSTISTTKKPEVVSTN